MSEVVRCSDEVRVQGARLYLRPLTLHDVNEKYLGWMNDPEVNQYLESRFNKHTVESLTEFVNNMNADPNVYFFAICLRQNGVHIGNIKLGPINRQHRRADIGIMIGDKQCWGKGFAAESICMLTRFAFEKLDLNKLTAGCYAENSGSARAFEKCGWYREGLRKNHSILKNKPHDSILLGISMSDYFKVSKK